MSEETSLHVRRAKQGDSRSLAWIAERFTPLLLVQARYRLGRLARVHEPEDLVNEVWAAALPVLPTLSSREGRETPVLLRFLATTLVYKANEWARRELRRGGTGRDPVPRPGSLSAETRGAVTRAVREEAGLAVRRAIEELPERDRDVLVLRGVEQLSNARAAEVLGETPNAVSLRYNRVLARLRERLSGSLLDELSPDA